MRIALLLIALLLLYLLIDTREGLCLCNGPQTCKTYKKCEKECSEQFAGVI